MFGYRTDIDQTFQLMNHLQRRFGRLLEDYDWTANADASFPRTNVYDTGTAFVIEADLPGFSDENLEVTLVADVVTLSGQRQVAAPEGYGLHRQERAPLRFSRSYALPAKVDPEKVVATLKNGVLSLQLEKAPEVKPKQISVKVS